MTIKNKNNCIRFILSLTLVVTVLQAGALTGNSIPHETAAGSDKGSHVPLPSEPPPKKIISHSRHLITASILHHGFIKTGACRSKTYIDFFMEATVCQKL